MAFNTKINLDKGKVTQITTDNLTLSGQTEIQNPQGKLKYSSHPTFTGNTQIVDKKYVDDSVVSATGSTVYTLATPATVTVGGVTAGSQLTGKTSNQILEEMLVVYLNPTFSAFGSTVLTTPVEVGCQITGSNAFCWTFSNSSNVQANTMCIRDVSNSTTLAINISTSSPQSATITTHTFNSCGDSQVWCGSAKNTCSSQFNSGSFTVNALLPYYYGKCTCPGAAGVGRPTLTGSQVTGGTKVLATSAGAISISFSSTSDDYLWFAVPATITKSCWCVTALNNGAIGGGVSAGCNLFPAPNATPVTSVCWAGCSYNVYVSNYQSAVSSAMSLS